MSSLTQPFAESLQKLLHKTCAGNDEEQCTTAQEQLQHLLEMFPDNTSAVFEWLMDCLDDEANEQTARISVLRTLSITINITPTLAPKALDKLSAIVSDVQNPQAVSVAAQQTLNVVKRAMPSAVTWSTGVRDRYDRQYVHCPLCHCATLYPELDGRRPAIIFLDIDEVVMHEGRYRDEIDLMLQKLFPHVEYHSHHSYTSAQQLLAQARYPDKDALESLHDLIDKIEESGQRPLLVITSAARHPVMIEQQRTEIYAQYKFSEYICGKTPPEGRFDKRDAIEHKLGFDFCKNAQERYDLSLDNRGDAIEFWLRDHSFDPATANFVVLNYENERSCLSRFGKKFIKTFLFDSKYVEAVIKILCNNQVTSA